MQHNFIVESEYNNSRLDKYIAAMIDSCSRSQAKFLILNNMVSINGANDNNYRRILKSNDKVFLTFKNTPIILKPFDLKLNIVFEDEYLAVLDKPPNLTVHPGVKENHKTLANALVAQYAQLSTMSGSFRPGIVHRLDKDTSGLIIIAKNNDVHIKLKGQIIERNIKRSYLAVTFGVPMPKIGHIATRIAPMKHDPTKMYITNDINAKLAITHYRVIESFENQLFALVECNLDTGRTHQIRVHMHFKNSPIVGDKKYASHYNFNADIVSNNLLAYKIKNLNRHALHAHKIQFSHPITNLQMSFESPLEKNLTDIVNLMKKDMH